VSFETLLVGCLARAVCPPARLFAPRGFPPPGDELCVELGSDRWATGLVPSGLRLCGVLRGGAKSFETLLVGCLALMLKIKVRRCRLGDYAMKIRYLEDYVM
jgi:hypothetical protein